MALLSILASVLSVLTPPAKPLVSTPDPVVSTPTPGGADVQAGRALPVSSGPSRGLASWYPMRPVTCDGAPVPSWVKAWTASLTLPCGTMVRLSGPGGSITVPVEDRGPERWTGRLFDLNPAAFIAVAGNLWSGVVPVSWQLA